MSSLFTRHWLIDTTERVIVTAAQAAIALFAVDGFNLAEFDFTAGATAVGVAAVLAFLKAVVAGGATSDTVSPASLAQDHN